MTSSFYDHLKKYEGFSPTAKWDYKQHSNGYGTVARYPGEHISQEEALTRLQGEEGKARELVRSMGVPMTQAQEDALTDLTYNAGTKWMSAGLGRAVRAGDWEDAKSRFVQYNQAGGEMLPWLLKRRQALAPSLTAASEPAAMSTAGATPPALSTYGGAAGMSGPIHTNPNGAFEPPPTSVASTSPVMPPAESEGALGGLGSWLFKKDGDDDKGESTFDKLGSAFMKGQGESDKAAEQVRAMQQKMMSAQASQGLGALAQIDQRQKQAVEEMKQRRQGGLGAGRPLGGGLG